MACAIHHGGGVGTYKTFSVIQRHAIPQLQSGRTVISTVRGFDSIRVIEAVLDIEIPEQSKIIFVDLETVEGIEKIRRWWEWVPRGAYIIIDEAQLIYPKSKRVTSYDYPARNGLTSEQAAEEDERPNGFMQAFTMQRHYNWDLAVITPNIKMLLPEITQVTQVAYEHKYMGGLVPWAKHGWREIQHDPMSTGRSSKHPPVRYTADKRIYKVYKSTKTGTHSAANAERSIFQNPKIISTFGFALLSLCVCFYILFNRFFSEKGVPLQPETDVSIVQVSDTPRARHGSSRNNNQTSVIQSDVIKKTVVEATKFRSKTMSIVGKFFDEYTIEIGEPPNAVQLTTGYLFNNGVKLKIVSDCLIEMTFDNVQYNVRCPLHKRHFDSPVDDSRVKQVPVEVKPFAALTGA
jgi:zona occludens toxin